MSKVAGVNDELGRLRQRVDAVHGLLEGGGHILIWRPVEPDVAVADLDEPQLTVALRHHHAAVRRLHGA
jgi:hypothetical protein